MSDKTQIVVALSPFITWPVTFWSPQEDGPEIEVSWPMRFVRPMAADTKRYREERRRQAERASKDIEEKIAAPLQKLSAEQRALAKESIDPALHAMLDAPVAAAISDEGREQRLKDLHDPGAWRAAFWRGWRTQTLTDTNGKVLDPDSAEDRAYILTIEGMEQAIDHAIEQMMLGGRQKNSRPPLGR